MGKYFVACDAGGTMTDVIIVDEEGQSVIGKAPTSPQDESVGYMESLEEALEYIKEDEYVEVTPRCMRMRKVILDENERKRAGKNP